jgi:hypothetical protein
MKKKFHQLFMLAAMSIQIITTNNIEQWRKICRRERVHGLNRRKAMCWPMLMVGMIHTRWSWHVLLRRFQLLSLIVCDLIIISMACVWSCHRNDELMYNACFACFCMWVQHVVCPTVVEEEKKDQIHDQNGSKLNLCMSFKDIRDRQNSSRVSSPRRRSRRSAPPSVALGLGPWRQTTVPR